MKRSLLIISCLLASLISICQSKKLEIVCEVFGDRFNYGGLVEFLPDSLKNSTIISLQKKHRLSGLELINVLCLNGWKLFSVSEKVVNNSDDGVYSKVIYHLKREIIVSDEEFLAIQKRINSRVFK